MRAQERMPRRKLSSSYFSLGLWMRSSSSAKPARTTSMPSAFLSSWVTGIEPPPPMKTAARAPLVGQRLARLGEGRRVDREADRAARAVLVKLHLAVGRQTRAHEIAERGADGVRVLVEHQAERDLGRGPGRDHRLEALALVAAAHAVDLAGRPRPGHLEHAAATLACRHREPDGTEKRAPGRTSASSHCSRRAAGSSGTPS